MITRAFPAVVSLIALSACDRQDGGDISEKIQALEQRTAEETRLRKQLELELEQQKLAAERDAIERERMIIEQQLAALEDAKTREKAALEEEIRAREEALARREGGLERQAEALAGKEEELLQKEWHLSDREMELAGRESLTAAGPASNRTVRMPVADYGMFYDSLASYGSWFESPDYGYVWQPAVVREADWRPYSRGRWVCTDRGWTWISDEPFGWATYHYGRWALVRGLGWIWVPGDEWAPAWVSWRESNSHIGWAPLPPETLAYRGHRWDSSVEITFGIGPLWFNFVEYRHFAQPVRPYCLPVARNVTYISQTTNITHIHVQNQNVIVGGPRYKDVSRRVGKPVPFYRMDVESHRRPGRDLTAMRPRISGDRISVHAPDISAPWNEALEPAKLGRKTERLEVERPARLTPEVTETFRKNRELRRASAEKSLRGMGGREGFQEHRRKILEQNRLTAEKKAAEMARLRDEAGAADKETAESERRKQAEERRRLIEEQRNAREEEVLKQRQEEAGAADKETAESERRKQAEERRRLIEEQRKAREEEVLKQRQEEANKETYKAEREAAEMERHKQTEERQRVIKEQQKAREEEALQHREESEAQRRQQEEPQRRQQEEAQRRQQEEAQRRQQEEAQRRQQEEAQRRQQEEAQRRQQEEAQRRQQEETQRRQQEEAQRRQQEEEPPPPHQDQQDCRDFLSARTIQ